MSARIDWITLVGRRQLTDSDLSVFAAYHDSVEAALDIQPTFKEVFGDPLEWQVVRPRAPYSFARRSDDNTRTMYVHPLASHFTIEVSGTYCAQLSSEWTDVLSAWEGNMSRLDIAVDMLTDVSPFEFEAAITDSAQKTRSQFLSGSGQTVYRGSRSSTRYARIYRYNPPHPRSHLLRAEFQLKSEHANATAHALASGISVNAIAAGLGQTFGFAHSCWDLREQPISVKVPSHAQSGNTVHWLTNTVAPLLRRLDREGKLDVNEWFKTYVREAGER